MNLKKIKDSKGKVFRVKDSEDDLELLATSYVSKENAIDLYNSGYTVVTIPSGVDTDEYANAVLSVLEDLFDEPEVNFDYGRKDLETNVNNNLLEISVSQVTDSSKTKISDAELSAEEKQEIIDWILANYLDRTGRSYQRQKPKVQDLVFNGNRVSYDGDLELIGHGNFTNGKFTWDIVSGNFKCGLFNTVNTLAGSPERVGGFYYVSSNHLTSLEGAPSYVGDYFQVKSDNLTSLEGCPQTVGGNLQIWSLELNSLEFISKNVGGDFICNTRKVFDEEYVRSLSNIKGDVIMGDLHPEEWDDPYEFEREPHLREEIEELIAAGYL